MLSLENLKEGLPYASHAPSRMESRWSSLRSLTAPHPKVPVMKSPKLAREDGQAHVTNRIIIFPFTDSPHYSWHPGA
jgi:hypothetical protein